MLRAIVILFLMTLPIGCGVTGRVEPVRVDHYMHLDIEGIAQYCQTVCYGNPVCFDDCFNRFVDLLTDPEVCVDLNRCVQ